jgi:PTH2 family peptidyl-tRNA hydrolase
MKQVIVIRKDLKMRRGKEIAQGSHASMAFLLKGDFKRTELTEWLETGQTKVCLQVHSEEELLELDKKAKEMGLTSNIITDAGRTEFGGVPTKTCMAIGPNESDKINEVTGHLKLY